MCIRLLPLQRELQAPVMNVNINLIVSADLAVIGHISAEAEVRGRNSGPGLKRMKHRSEGGWGGLGWGGVSSDPASGDADKGPIETQTRSAFAS